MLHEFVIGYLPQLGEVPLAFAEVGVGCIRVEVCLGFSQDVVQTNSQD